MSNSRRIALSVAAIATVGAVGFSGIWAANAGVFAAAERHSSTYDDFDYSGDDSGARGSGIQAFKGGDRDCDRDKDQRDKDMPDQDMPDQDMPDQDMPDQDMRQNVMGQHHKDSDEHKDGKDNEDEDKKDKKDDESKDDKDKRCDQGKDDKDRNDDKGNDKFPADEEREDGLLKINVNFQNDTDQDLGAANIKSNEAQGVTPTGIPAGENVSGTAFAKPGEELTLIVGPEGLSNGENVEAKVDAEGPICVVVTEEDGKLRAEADKCEK